jgi:plastocyanin
LRFAPFLFVALAAPLAAAVVPLGATVAPHYVDVIDYDFVDHQLGNEFTLVPVGTTVTWIFPEENHGWHTVQSTRSVSQGGLDEIEFDSGDKPPRFEQSFSYTFLTAGVVVYTCDLHAMTGYVVVEP